MRGNDVHLCSAFGVDVSRFDLLLFDRYSSFYDIDDNKKNKVLMMLYVQKAEALVECGFTSRASS